MVIPDNTPLPANGWLVSGVYSLFLAGELQYVGQSTNILSRVGVHYHLGKIKFDTFSFERCAPEQLNDLEKKRIIELLPPLNCRNKKPRHIPYKRGKARVRW